MGELETLYNKKEINTILKRVPELIELQKTYEKVKYLGNLGISEKHDEFIYEIYEPIMKMAATSSRPFTDFTQVNYDTLTRLKWRWLA